MHEVHRMDAATMGGTTVSVDSSVGGNEEQVFISTSDDGGEKGGSVRQSPSRHCVGEDDDV